MRVFSPGEELDNGVAQELQPLVVIDPGGGWRTGGGRLDGERVREIRANQQDIPGGRRVVLSQAGHDVDQGVDA